MQSFKQWIASQGKWVRSRFSDLPDLRHDDDTRVQHWCAIAGGLALILSRAGQSELATRFSASRELYELLRRQLKQGDKITAGGDLLGDVMHEVAGIADPMTRVSLQVCFRTRVKHDAERTSLARQGTASRPPSQPASQHSRPPATRSPSLQMESRVLLPELVTPSRQLATPPDFVNSDIFIEQSSALRKKVAQARATVYGELR